MILIDQNALIELAARYITIGLAVHTIYRVHKRRKAMSAISSVFPLTVPINLFDPERDNLK